MKKAYILVYSDDLGTRSEVRDCMNDLLEVWTWRFDMPNSFYIISEYEADDIANAIREYLGNKGRFLVSEITSNKQGWLPSKTWHLINKKSHKKE